MSENQGVSDTEKNASGSEPKETDQVAYETHRKLLGEKKRIQEEFEKANAKIKDFEKREKERVEQELKAKEDWKKLVEMKDQELQEKSKILQQVEQEKIEAKKLSSVLKALGGEVDQKYWGHFELDKVLLDPNTQQVDALSVSKLVDEFKKTYPEIIRTPDNKAMPNNFPAGGAATLSYEEWLKLPAKEMKARYKEVINKP